MYDMTIKHIYDEHANFINKENVHEFGKCLEVVQNNEACALFKVKKNKSLNLIKLGCFDGDETMFRITKTKGYGTHTVTKWNTEGKAFSWQFGSSTTMVGDNLTKIRELLVWLVEVEMGTKLEL